MDIFNKKALSKLQMQLNELQSRVTVQQGYNYVNNAIARYPAWDELENINKYCTNDDIHAIIKRLVNGCLQVKMYTYYQKSTTSVKQLKQYPIGGDVFNLKALQVKALEDAPDNDPIVQLIQSPSFDVSPIDFYEALYSFLFTSGKCYIRINTGAEGGVNQNKPVSLDVIPYQYLIPRVTLSYPKRVVSYDYIIDGIEIEKNIPEQDVIVLKYFNPLSALDGLSPIEVLKRRITRMDANMDNSVAQMQNSGVKGILFDEMEDTTTELSNARKEALYSFMSRSENTGSVHVDQGKLSYIQLGLKLADLEALELANVDFDKVCNMYGISSTLFNSKAASTESNVKEMRKAFYTDAVLPNVMRVASTLEFALNNRFTDKKRVINADYSDIPELQPDNKTLAEWLKMCDWITPNEKRLIQKFDLRPEPEMDRILIPTGLMFIEDLAGTQDLPITQDYLNTTNVN